MIAPDNYFWTQLVIRVAVEAACVVGIAMFLERLVRPAFWRRALWQAAVVCLLLLTASEMTGFGRGLASFLNGPARPEQKPAVWTRPVESAPLPSPRSSPPSYTAPAPVPVPFAVFKPEIARPVWWPGILWFAGALAVLGRVAAAQILFISLRRRRADFANNDLNSRAAAILRRLAVRRKIRLLQSPGLAGPIAFGIFRPTVGLPADFAVKFSPAEQDAMLAHELAHLAARDPLWYLLADTGCAALWWHPQAWWARHCLHRASELAADEAAAIFPEGPATLAGCLVTLGRQMAKFPAASRMGIEGGGFRSNLAERVQRLLHLADTTRQPSYGWRSRAARLAAILASSAAAIALAGCLQSRDAEKPPTLQASLSQSWSSSPAATVWHSALPPKKSEPPPALIPARFQPAQQESVSLGMGIFHIEPTSFISTMQRLFPNAVDPQPGIMLHRYFESVGINMTNAGSFTLFNPRTGDLLARTTTRNLDSIEQAVDLLKTNPPVDSVDRAKKLVNESRTNGRFFLHEQPEQAPLETGQEERMFRVDTNYFPQALRDAFPQFPAPQAATNVLAGSARNNSTTNRNFPESDWVKSCFVSLGILTDKGSFLIFNERTGDVLVKDNIQELDLVERVMELLNKAPPQVQIDVKFVTLSQKDANGVIHGFAINLGIFPIEAASNAAGTPLAPSPHGTTNFNNPTGIFPGRGPAGSNPGQMAPSASDTTAGSDPGTNAPFELRVAPAEATLTGILTGPQFRLTIQAIEQSEGAKILSMPGITTDSGRKASISLTNLLDASSGAPVAAALIVPGATSNRVVEDPVVDVLPTVLADGYVIHLDLTAFGRENVGYDKSAQLLPPSNGGSSQQAGVSATSAPRLPSSVNYSINNSVSVWDGQTVMLPGLIVESHPARTEPTNSHLQNLMIFVTPRIVDSAGNPLHTDDELKDFQKHIPPQAAVSPPK
jgi:beta-lactamase regulating signal transducer with metallopeptidase domain/type II secretory pathway component GspD/PulD (secretin)